MTKNYIELGDNGWAVILCYNIRVSDSHEIASLLTALGCPKKELKKAVQTVTRKSNSALTFSNTDFKMSLVCIGDASSTEQLLNSIAHEAKHVQSHICEYYDIDEDGEIAAYLIGYIVQRMYRAFVS